MTTVDGTVVNVDKRRDRVYRADNADSHWTNGLMILAVFAIGSAVFGYFTESTRGAVILFLALTAFAMVVITGALPAIIAMLLEHRADVKESDVQMAKVKADEAVALKELEVQQDREEYQFQILNAAAEKDQQVLELERKVAYLVDNAMSSVPQADSFVPANPAPMKRAAVAWVSSLYLSTGGFDKDMVYGDPPQLRRVPWNNEWMGKEWKTKAKKLLLKSVIRTDTSGKNFYVKYGTATDALSALRREMDI